MKSAPRILLLPDFGPAVGGGHAMRCLTLGRAMARAGGDVALAASPSARAALAPYWPEDIEVVTIGDPLTDGPKAARDWRADAVVVDHYGAGADIERHLGGRVIVLDDLADRPHDCKLLIDPGLAREPGDYAALAPGARLLIGPDYALVRPAFAEARMGAPGRRREGMRVLLSLGLTDVGGITGRLAGLILPLLQEGRLDVVLSAAAPSRASIEALAAQDPRLALHLDVADMAALMARVDLAVGGGGSSVWERACLGLPSLCVVLADNQAELADEMARRGLCLAADVRKPEFENAFTAALRRLLEDAELRGALSARSAAICDGLGPGRVVNAIMELCAR